MADRNITTNIILKGTDAMSGPLGRAADKTMTRFDKIGNRMRMISYGAFNIGRTMAYSTGAIAAPLIFATKKALDFEDQMASVAKVANVEFGSNDFKELGREARDLSKYLGVGAIESAKIFEVLAQSGMARKELASVAKIAGEVSVAFGIEQETAGNAFSYIKNLLALDVSQTRDVADAINSLSNTRNATAERILTFMSSGGAGVAKAHGMSGQEAAAFGATLIVNGKSGEEAATVMERFAKGIRANKDWGKIYKEAGEGANGFFAILKAGLKAKDPGKFFDKMGLYGADVKTLALSMTEPRGLIDALSRVSDRYKYAGSAQAEFEAKMKAGKGDIKRAWAEFNSVMIEVGDNAIPILRQLLKDFTPILKSFGEWVRDNPNTVTAMTKVVMGVAALAGVMTVGSYAVGVMATGVRAYSAVMGFLAKSSFFVQLAGGIRAVSVAMITSPVGWFAAALYGLSYAAMKTNENLMYLPETMTKIVTGTKALFRNVIPLLGALSRGEFDKAAAISARADMEAYQDMRTSVYGDTRRMTMEERRQHRRTGKMPKDYFNGDGRGLDSHLWEKMMPKTYQNNKIFGSVENKTYMSDAAGSEIRINPKTGLEESVIPIIPRVPTANERGVGAKGDTTTIHYSPTINLAPGTPKEVAAAVEQASIEERKKFEQEMKKYKRNTDRKSYVK